MTYSIEYINKLQIKLENMPEQDANERKVSTQEAVALLTGEIKALQARGYTLDQIADTLRGDGMDIRTTTLKTYLQRANNKTKKQRATRQSTSKKQMRAISNTTPDTPAKQAEKQADKQQSVFAARPDSDDI